MKRQEKIYIIGHKNPDTDSICSAIAYADIKNRTTQGKRYIAKRAGQINEETEYVLKRFGVHAPGYMPNVGTQVEDMDIHEIPPFEKTMSMKSAFEFMKDNNIVTLPITDPERHLEGLVSISDIAQVYLDTADSYLLSSAKTQYKRIVETLQGTLLAGNEEDCFTEGSVLIAAVNPQLLDPDHNKKAMVILGDREEDQLETVRQEASCIIIGLNMPVSEKVLKLAKEKGTVVISSPLDTFTIARLINQSIPISYVMKTRNLVSFSTEDFTDDIQEIMVKKRHQAFPVIDPKGHCIGTISRRNSTIMYDFYNDQKLEISPKMAGLLCSAIISDTLMFRSPTCTLKDKMAAGALALIAGIDIPTHAKEMFRAGSDLAGKTTDQIFYQDYKKFIAEGDLVFGVGQISSMDDDDLKMIKEQLLPFLKVESQKHSVGKVYFMLTNILEESTELLYYGDGSDELVRTAFHKKPQDGSFILPGVVSRKKQLIPAMMKAAQQLNTEMVFE